MSSAERVVLAFLAVVTLAGCAAPMTSAVQSPLQSQLMSQVGGEQAKCKVAASQANPLVTEWPASEKANLELLLRRGGVAVAYSGCSMRLLPQCPVPGAYVFQRTSPSTDAFAISNEDELYAKLPLGAASLEGELKRWGKLSVHTQVVGQVRLQDGVPPLPMDGECAYATHIMTALSVGAFTLQVGDGVSVGAGAAALNVVSAGGKTQRSTDVVRSAGDWQYCSQTTDDAPNPNCRSPIQMFLTPVPGRGTVEGPPGTIKVDLLSAHANARWDVYVDDAVICTTPCSAWLNPFRPVFLRAREDGFFAAPDKIRLTRLGPYGENIQVQAHPTNRGELATGIVFTSFGGMAALTGITLTSVGCAGQSSGMCTGGLITLAAGGAVTAGAIWLILDSMPKVQIYSSEGSQLPLLVVGPGTVFGTF